MSIAAVLRDPGTCRDNGRLAQHFTSIDNGYHLVR